MISDFKKLQGIPLFQAVSASKYSTLSSNLTTYKNTTLDKCLSVPLYLLYKFPFQ